jgi:hypothetical protein
MGNNGNFEPKVRGHNLPSLYTRMTHHSSRKVIVNALNPRYKQMKLKGKMKGEQGADGDDALCDHWR